VEEFWAAEEWHPRLAQRRLDTLAGALRWNQGPRISWAADGLETIRVKLDETGGSAVYLKRYAAYRGDWRYFWRARRLLQEVAALRWMEKHRLPAPPLVAWGRRRHFGVTTAAVLMTAEAAGTEQLRAALHSGRTDWTHRRRRLTATLSGLIAAMHRGGMFHGNLFLRNILYRSATGEFLLIDFPASTTRPGWPGRPFATVRDLSSLAKELTDEVTLRDRMRFVTLYVKQRWPALSGAIRRRKVRRLWRGASQRLERLLKRSSEQLRD
jgi:tRNA A-37 threonylcarbamoyl transferase component Bud32